MARYYDTQTDPFYRALWDDDDLHLGLFEPDEGPEALRAALDRMTRAIVAPAGLAPGDRVLDAGCGVGGAALHLAREHGCRVLGLTISERQVEIARDKARAQGLGDRLTFERADCSTHLPVADGSIDVVVTIEAGCHFASRPAFLAECARVLVPGGRLVGSDWMAREGLDGARGQAIERLCRSWFLADLETAAGYARHIAQAGLRLTGMEDLGPRLEPNVQLMLRSAMLLEARAARGEALPEAAGLWKAQLVTLPRAWRCGAFTICRFVALAPSAPSGPG